MRYHIIVAYEIKAHSVVDAKMPIVKLLRQFKEIELIAVQASEIFDAIPLEHKNHGPQIRRSRTSKA